ERVSIAAINGPSTTLLSGETATLNEVILGLQQRGVNCRLLPVNYAFHSPQMEPFRPELVAALDGLTPRRANIPVVSTVAGAATDGTLFDPAYWGRNLREPVRFAQAVDALSRDGYTLFVEVGPHPVLSPQIIHCLAESERDGAAIPSLRRG